MKDTALDSFLIFRLDDNRWRVNWQGSLENLRPAEDAEHLVLELNGDDELRRATQYVELDLANCLSINSRGIAFLIYLRRRLATYEVQWSIVNAPTILKRMLHMFNLGTAFHLIDPEMSSPPRGARAESGERTGLSTTLEYSETEIHVVIDSENNQEASP